MDCLPGDGFGSWPRSYGRRSIFAGPRITVDESMGKWTGKDMPGQDRDREKEEVQDWGVTTATTLRLVKPCQNSNYEFSKNQTVEGQGKQQG
eukprot:g82000.t1